MKYFSGLVFVLLLCAFTAEDTRKQRLSGCFLRSQTPAKGISKKQTQLDITFTTNTGGIITDSIRFSHNGKLGVLHPDAKGFARVSVPAGTTRFQFLYTTGYYEIYSDTLALKGGHIAVMEVVFESADQEVIVDKPVIYVYPETTTAVSISLDVHGEFLFTYPAYYTPGPNDSAVAGWHFTAYPDGSIHTNGKEYDYLFWDAALPVATTFNLTPAGFIVERDSLVTFFEQKLAAMNLSPREQQDFITYWCPRMQKIDKSYVRFVFNEAYDQFATMKVVPQPQNIFRVMMIWQDAAEMSGVNILPQDIPAAKRDGFTVIEWGGAEISAQLAVRSAQ